jgi:hypothetical protein
MFLKISRAFSFKIPTLTGASNLCSFPVLLVITPHPDPLPQGERAIMKRFQEESFYDLEDILFCEKISEDFPLP